MTGNRKSQAPGALKDAEGKILLDTKEKLSRWKEYVEQLLEDYKSEMAEQEPVVSEEKSRDQRSNASNIEFEEWKSNQST